MDLWVWSRRKSFVVKKINKKTWVESTPHPPSKLRLRNPISVLSTVRGGTYTSLFWSRIHTHTKNSIGSGSSTQQKLIKKASLCNKLWTEKRLEHKSKKIENFTSLEVMDISATRLLLFMLYVLVYIVLLYIHNSTILEEGLLIFRLIFMF